MFAVIFEVEINEERKNEYLIIASILKEQLVNQKGFISVERFQSLINEKTTLYYCLYLQQFCQCANPIFSSE